MDTAGFDGSAQLPHRQLRLLASPFAGRAIRRQHRYRQLHLEADYSELPTDRVMSWVGLPGWCRLGGGHVADWPIGERKNHVLNRENRLWIADGPSLGCHLLPATNRPSPMLDATRGTSCWCRPRSHDSHSLATPGRCRPTRGGATPKSNLGKEAGSGQGRADIVRLWRPTGLRNS